MTIEVSIHASVKLATFLGTDYKGLHRSFNPRQREAGDLMLLNLR